MASKPSGSGVSDRELKRRISRAHDLTEPPLRKLLGKLGVEFQIADWHPYHWLGQTAPTAPVHSVFYELMLTHGGQGYAACAVVSDAPYDRGCGKLLLFLRANGGQELEVCLLHTMPGDRSFEGPRSRWLARKLRLIAAVADRLTIDDDELVQLRTRLDDVCTLIGEQNLLYAEDLMAKELAAVEVRPGKRQRPSALAAERASARA